MNNLDKLTPLVATHPGEILKDELDTLGKSQSDFAMQIGLIRSQLNEIIKGKRNINAEVALLLEKALGIDAEYWMEAQKNYDLDKARFETKHQKRLESIEQWKTIAPLIGEKFLKKEKLISGDPVIDIPKVWKIFNVDNIDQLSSLKVQPEFARFRKSDKLLNDPINFISWVKLVQYKASELIVGKFENTKKDSLISELRAILCKNTDTLNHVQSKLAEYGIKLIYQSKGEKTPIDGISFWSKGNPAIGMSLRHSRLDNFAFTLFHELGHVYLHLINNNKSEFIDLILSKESILYKKNRDEEEADNFATNKLIDETVWMDFFSNTESFTDKSFRNFATQAGIHPSIVKGRYCHQINNYKVRTLIDSSIN